MNEPTPDAPDTVTVRIENAYSCGRTSDQVVSVPPPVSATDDDLDQWWQDVVHPHTGDGHPCGSRDDALHEARVTEAPTVPALVGASYEW